MAINKIKTNSLDDTAVSNAKLGADAVDATKIANDAISEEHIDNTAITGHTQLSANAASDDVLLIFDASSSTIKKINAGNVGLQAPTISSISPTNLLTGDGSGNHTIVITGTGYLADASAKLTTDGGTDIAFDSITRNSATQLTCVVAKNTANLTNANEPFDVTVTVAGALAATSANAITIDGSPVFVTSAGSLGTVAESTSGSFTVLAQDPESSATAVTYELQSGSLPTNFSITNQAANGGQCVISGTAPAVSANTTYNFVIRAVDAASNVSSRAFAITVTNNPVSTSFTSSGTFAVPSGVTVVDVLVVGGGGGGGGGHDGNTNVGGGAGAGGLIFFPDYPVTPGGTITVTVGDGGPHINPSSPTGQPIEAQGVSGQDSVFGAPTDPGKHPSGDVLTAKGGGAGGGGRTNVGVNGGSGGGGGSSSQYGPRCNGTGIQPTQPGDSGAYGFGTNGGTGVAAGKIGAGGGGAGGGGQGGGPGNGRGGIGKAYTIGDGTTSVYYAGGGGGGGGNAAGPYSAGADGGQGGGGAGQNVSPLGNRPDPEGQGQANKGGGGGGGATPGRAAFQGGKGIVIVRG